MSDLYDTLSPSAQATVRAKLLAVVQSKPCPAVDTTAITNADSMSDAGNRAMAIDCFQTSHAVKGGVAGVLDQTTYSALVGWWPALPLWQKVVGGVAVGGLGWFGFKHLSKKRRR